MSKLTRVTQNVFASSAPAAATGIAQFGSKAAGSPAFTTNPATAQALSEWLSGLYSAVVAGNSIELEDLNALFFVITYQLAYILQEGIAEWDSGTTYYQYSFVQSGGLLYQSTANNNLNNNPTSSSQWSPIVTVFNGGADSGTANAYALTIPNFPSNANIPNGTILFFVPANTNTGSSTLSINGQSALPIFDKFSKALNGFDLVSGAVYLLVFGAAEWFIAGYSTNASQYFYGGTSGGSANAQTMLITGFQLRTGTSVVFTAGESNTGALTLNISSTGAIAVHTKANGATVGGEIVSGSTYILMYNGTNYVIVA